MVKNVCLALYCAIAAEYRTLTYGKVISQIPRTFLRNLRQSVLSNNKPEVGNIYEMDLFPCLVKQILGATSENPANDITIFHDRFVLLYVSILYAHVDGHKSKSASIASIMTTTMRVLSLRTSSAVSKFSRNAGTNSIVLSTRCFTSNN